MSRKKHLFGFLFFIAFFAPFLYSSTTEAASLANWNAGKIIDDAVFTNNNTMSPASIQSFLNSKVPVCDTYGSQPSEYGGGTRAEWGQANYGQNTFTCLKDYRENGKSAAQIIYDTAQEFKINPQVLIVLLQKEQGLVTDTWPLNIQYRTATGYGCPDTAPCDSQYFGLTNQLRWSGRMFRAIINNSPTWYTPYVLGTNYIRYSPDTSCGGSNVTIQNRATQALYNYTPYQPNAGALAAGYGTAYCGAYGNRNFYLYFVDWFGSTTAVNANITLAKNITVNKSTSSIYRGDTITANFEVSNSASYSMAAGGLGVCGRLNGQWFDFGFIHHNQIAAGGKATISFSKRITEAGTLKLYTCSYNELVGGWASDFYPYNGVGTERSLTINVKANPQLTSSVSLSKTSPTAGESVTATFAIKNNSNNPINIGRMVLAVRGPDGKNYDFPSDIVDGGTVITAGGTYNFSKVQNFLKPGKYTYSLMNRHTNGWRDTYPTAASSSIIKKGSFTVQDTIDVTSSITSSPTTPVAGEPVTTTITLKNNGPTTVNIGRLVLSVRNQAGANYDFPSSTVSIASGQTVTYSKTQTFSDSGTYKIKLMNNYNGQWLDYPTVSPSSSTLYVSKNPAIISYSIQTTPQSGGTKVTATTQIKNTTSQAINIGRLVYAVRAPSGNNVDLPSNSEVIVPANSTYTYTKERVFSQEGTYRIFLANKKNGLWDMTYPDSPPTINRSRNFTIQ